MNIKNLSFIFHLFAAIFFVLGIFLIVLPSPSVSAFPPMDATPVGSDLKNPKYLKDPCEKQSNNLLKNGGMGPDRHDTPYGTVADQWNPFIFTGSPPQFRVVDNEGVDGVSQQIFTGDTFDAGVMQTVYGTQPSSYYWVRWGWVVSAKSGGGYSVDNASVDSIISKIGADPYGGTDPKSPNIVWGPDYISHKGSMNPLQTILVFPARADHATIFLRTTAKEGGNGENREWMDALCMEARPELGSAPPPEITATPVPTAPPPTATRTQSAPTRAPRAPTFTPLPLPSATLAVTEAPTQIAIAPVATRPRPTAPSQAIRARPTVAPSALSLPDLDTGTLMNLGFGSIGSSAFFFITGLILARYAFK